ncbi:hypothetical protein [Streptomyces sp. NPDC051214]|uniref:hypothetical protein n=1 Tax=Streptomyces sp. NPDC051214 TaxID=3155282 RepID=UPI00342177AE
MDGSAFEPWLLAIVANETRNTVRSAVRRWRRCGAPGARRGGRVVAEIGWGIEMRMRTARAVCGSVTGFAAALALVVAGAPQAVAGGSTSVLVVAPGSGESTALYVSDKEYAELEAGLGHLGADIGKGQREQPPGLAMGDGSRQINVTWMVHDVRPWRVDRAYPVAPGTKGGGDGKGSKGGKGADAVWIHTTTDVESMRGVWHKAKDPAHLTALFKKLGVLGPPTDKGNQAIGPGSDSNPPPTPASEAEAEAGAGAEAGAESGQAAARGGTDVTPGDGGTDWWWAIPGAAAGAAGALLLRGSLVGRRPHEGGPRQELRDL